MPLTHQVKITALWSGIPWSLVDIYEGWNFNFGDTPLDWIQELLEWRANAAGRMGPSPTYINNGSGPSRSSQLSVGAETRSKKDVY